MGGEQPIGELESSARPGPQNGARDAENMKVSDGESFSVMIHKRPGAQKSGGHPLYGALLTLMLQEVVPGGHVVPKDAK